MRDDKNVITIDGPSASGKSSVSRGLAKRLGWRWVSTGAFYRALAYVAHREQVDPHDGAALVRLAHASVWSVRLDDDRTRILYQNADVTDDIMSEENGSRASVVSHLPEVRVALLENQRDCARGVPGLVAEGRDCGTVVFPEARLKVYLTASAKARAARRALEHNLDVADVHAQQKVRDHRDSNRAAAPLEVPTDGRVLDTGEMTLDEVVETIYQWAIPALGLA
jgi:cytidylate kinase